MLHLLSPPGIDGVPAEREDQGARGWGCNPLSYHR